MAKNIFVNYYLDQAVNYDHDNLISSKMWDDLSNQANNILKEWLLKNFVIMKFSSKLYKEFILKYNEKMKNGKLRRKEILL